MMADLIQSGSVFLAGVHRAFASRDVTYTRGQESAVVPATVSPVPLQVTDDYGNVKVVRDGRGFQVHASDLVLGGAEVTPEAGDRIREPYGNLVHVHEVMPPEVGEPVWRWTDGSKTRRHVHTKLVGVE